MRCFLSLVLLSLLHLVVIANRMAAADLCYPTTTCTVTDEEMMPHIIQVPADPAFQRLGEKFISIRVKCIKPEKPPLAVDTSKPGKPLGTPNVYLAGAGCATEQTYLVPGGWVDYGTCGTKAPAACEVSHKE